MKPDFPNTFKQVKETVCFLNDNIMRNKSFEDRNGHKNRKKKLTSSPQDFSTVHNMSFPASYSVRSWAPTSPSGILRSSRKSPLSDIKQRYPSSEMSVSWKSSRFTCGTSILCVDGQISSYFLPRNGPHC